MFDKPRAKDKLAPFWDTVYISYIVTVHRSESLTAVIRQKKNMKHKKEEEEEERVKTCTHHNEQISK